MLAFLRFLAAVLLLIAVIALIYDGTRTLAASGMATTPFIEHWSNIAPASLKTAQAAVERYTHPLVWDPVLRRMLLLPAWALLGILGFVAAYAGRRRRRVNVYAN